MPGRHCAPPTTSGVFIQGLPRGLWEQQQLGRAQAFAFRPAAELHLQLRGQMEQRSILTFKRSDALDAGDVGAAQGVGAGAARR